MMRHAAAVVLLVTVGCTDSPDGTASALPDEGRFATVDDLEPARRFFWRGGFELRSHHSSNLAVVKVEDFRGTHPGDDLAVEAGGIRDLDTTREIVADYVRVEVSGLPASRAMPVAGDICLFTRVLGTDPRASVLHCTSYTARQDGLVRVVRFPDEVGLYLPPRSVFGCAVTFARSGGQLLDDASIADTRYRCELGYTVGPVERVGRIARIPYLDTIQSGPELIDDENWYGGQSGPIYPMRVLGFSAYLGPNFSDATSYFDVCITRRAGFEVRDSRCFVRQLFDPTQDLFMPQPGFLRFREPLVLQPGEFLSASCRTDAERPKDCALYALLELPRTAAPAGGGSLYWDAGHVNHDAVNRYCDTLDLNRVTSAGVDVLQNLAETDVVPWRDLPARSLKDACRQLFQPTPRNPVVDAGTTEPPPDDAGVRPTPDGGTDGMDPDAGPICAARRCRDVGSQCGEIDDGCGGTLRCGCPANWVCQNQRCEPQEPSCSDRTLEAAGRFRSVQNIDTGGEAWIRVGSGMQYDEQGTNVILHGQTVGPSCPGPTLSRTDDLRFFGAGLSVPADASILGVRVELDLRNEGNDVPILTSLRLWGPAPAAPVASNSVPGQALSLTSDYKTFPFGGEADTWGLSPVELIPAYVNHDGFGVRLSMGKNFVCGATARPAVDAATVRVTYRVCR